MTSSKHAFPPPKVLPLRPDVRGLRTGIVNVSFIGEPLHSDWVLVDTGLFGYGQAIVDFAKETFNGPPKAILLTHGHFDHVGTLKTLLEAWKCPVYAHPEELPYLNGSKDYPRGDPTVGGGLMAWISPIYPYKGMKLGDVVTPLPTNGEVPFLEEWSWVHTPGHTPGHVSFFRERDRSLLAGDAFINVNQESVFSVLSQARDLQGPPTYFTPDWPVAKASVEKLQSLEPAYALTGHGEPIEGVALKEGLHKLVMNFNELAVPEHGRFIDQDQMPADQEDRLQI